MSQIDSVAYIDNTHALVIPYAPTRKLLLYLQVDSDDMSNDYTPLTSTDF